eukprot:sb/3475916/
MPSPQMSKNPNFKIAIGYPTLLIDCQYQISDRLVHWGPCNGRRKMPFLAKNYKNILLLSGTRGWGEVVVTFALASAVILNHLPERTSCGLHRLLQGIKGSSLGVSPDHQIKVFTAQSATYR